MAASANMSRSDTASWADKNRMPVGAHYADTSSSDSSENLLADLSDWSDQEYLQDSVTKKRRHGVYFHRPPVWVSSSSQTEDQARAFADCKMCHKSGEECICDSDSLRETLDALYKERGSNTWSMSHGHGLFCKVTAATADALADIDASVSGSAGVPLLVDWDGHKSKWRNSTSITASSWLDRPLSSDEPLRNIPSSGCSYRQVKPGLCTRLKFQKDIRLDAGERWALQEGSLVICIDPTYTLLDHERRSDEFEIVEGDVYVVCRIYADLWALCVKASFIPSCEPSPGITNDSIRLGFLPLCAVTLAANFSAFSRRCSWLARTDADESMYPGNGLPVMPPSRSHSLTASKQIFKGNKHHLMLPGIAYDTFQNTSLSSDSDFIPLDSTLEQVLSRVGSQKRRPVRSEGRFSLHKIWNNVKASGIWKHDQSKGSLSYTPNSRSSKIWASERGRHYLGKKRRDSFSPTEKLMCLIGTS
ncbi:hypothetical protein BDV37DRAFT_116752 [Aspergillus pseudonomiae]|uniref:Uncharacterized protein n=1 Tax=Aspergillus pseudonomiae TaxID=1506151 RepID=A0A5N7DDB6_9EURO|nr:uncharacterized protein BDV37DRAFT_116752 [Aspergillus pseudonomiae]KAE8404229.1 hypothetical protein BDV37DRAFT_116752 [Aspergillus pseudonomiae]